MDTLQRTVLLADQLLDIVQPELTESRGSSTT